MDLQTYIKRIVDKRALIATFAKRDLSIQFAQTFLGLFWSILQPLTNLLIFTYFFTEVFVIDTRGVPYPLIAITGIATWNLFSYLLGHGGMSLVHNQEIIKKIYFPKIILPLSKVLTGLVEFLVSMGILVFLLFYYNMTPNWTIVFLPLLLILVVIVGLSFGLWMNLLTIRFRDFHQIIPFLLMIGMWISPVFYPSHMIPQKIQFLLNYNPVAGIIRTFRWMIIGGEAPSLTYFISYGACGLLLVGAVFVYARVEGKIVDNI